MRSKRTLRSKISPRISQKLNWKYVAGGIAIAAIVGVGLFFIFNLGMGGEIKAAGPVDYLVYSEQNGDWTDANSWSPRPPQAGDSLILKEGHTLTVSSMIELDGVYLGVYGTLFIENGKKINLINGSEIAVHSPSGTIDGGNEGSAGTKITYEKEAIWNSSDGPIFGYSTLDESGYNPPGTLPVELVYFKARAAKNKAVIEWATAMELNNDFFTIERSADGKDFEQLSTIEGAGNSSIELSYSFTDDAPLAGTSYYRLKQTDFDGKFEHFKLVAVTIEAQQQNKNLSILSVGPNPFSYDFNVEFELPEDGVVEMRLMNIQGTTVARETIEGYRGNNRYSFNDKQGLQNGTYIFHLVQNNTASKAIRLIKQ